MVCDVAAVVRRCPDLSWETLAARARSANSSTRLALGLLLARDVVGAPLPTGVSTLIDADRPMASLARRVGQGLLADDVCPLSNLDRLRLRLSCVDRPSGALRHPFELLWMPGYNIACQRRHAASSTT